ncbi:DUF6318 family protein [Georgenia sp. SYP-B2076]|uniref:DUF6318 family protein n=1 Tax=Georgenia sp. SYP-B2076 TaxID=2495881 RepID=UPI001F0C33DA|nr:DUF6318 family protein [Georgenia sp. SYP-B2076]
MRRDDVAGAEAAAQYFLELYPYVHRTGDLTEWRAMADPECIFCKSVADGVSELFDAGGHASGGEVVITGVEGRNPLSGNPYFRVDIDATKSSLTRVTSSGASESTAEGVNHLIVAVGREADNWIIREVQIEDEDFVG